MRLRNVKGSRDEIARNEYVIKKPERYRGSWREMMKESGHPGPIHIEIGMGKGRFLMEMASLHPEIVYIGIEKYSSVLVRALEKMEDSPLDNVVFIRMDAEYICQVFDKGEIDRIYLNFSDPWPKDRHAKRRLTSRQFLDRYDQILKEGGRIIFKTDNRALFDFSLEEIELAGWSLDLCTYDLHHSDHLTGNVMTEYEEKFVKKGNPICKLIAHHEE